jgi:hypothetical protein
MIRSDIPHRPVSDVFIGFGKRKTCVHRLNPCAALAEAGNPVQLSPIQTTNAGQGFQGFWHPTT